MLLRLRGAARDVVAGIKWGGIMGSLLSLWVAFLIPFNRSLVFRGRSGEGIHAGAIVLIYVLGGVVTGALFGAMRPLLQWRVGAAFLGALATVPIGVAFLISRIGFTAWNTRETGIVLIMALAFGAPGGLIIREFVRSEERRNAKQ